MSSAVDYAITQVKNAYAQALEQGCDKFICQLTKNNQGFSYAEIVAIKEAVQRFKFTISTHISILPLGKKPTNNRLFDGLQTIYSKEIAPCEKP